MPTQLEYDQLKECYDSVCSWNRELARERKHAEAIYQRKVVHLEDLYARARELLRENNIPWTPYSSGSELNAPPARI